MTRRFTPRALAVVVLATLLWVPAGWGTPASARCTGPFGAFRIGSHNVLHGKALFTGFAGVIGWQEVTHRADRQKLLAGLGPGYRHYVPATHRAAAIPVSWRHRNFQYVTSRSVKTHEGRKDITPSRWINVVHLRHRRTGERVVVVNTHFISGAFTPGHNAPVWRRHQWFVHRNALVANLAQIRKFHPRAAVFVLGDFNHQGYLDLSRFRLRPLRIGAGKPIDQLYAGRPGTANCVQKLSRVGSDHHRWRAMAWVR